MMVKLRTLLAPLFLFFLAITSISVKTLAQSDDIGWATPVNLSHSGAASSPVIVIVPDGTMRIFWWDEFDGTMVADGILPVPTSEETEGSTSEGELGTPASVNESWSTPRMATIRVPQEVTRRGERVVVPIPIEAAPRIVGDASGRAHAFWLGEPDEETGNIPLLYSRLEPDSTSWSSPTSLAGTAGSFYVTSDGTGRVHLVYVQTEPTQNLRVGLYYRVLVPGRTGWRSPTPVRQSRYVRLLSPDEDDLRLTADDAGNLYAAWDDVHQGQVLLARSADGGATWSEPEAFHGPGVQPEQDRVIAVPGSAPSMLWQSVGDPQARVAVSSTGSALKLAVWDGEGWSATRRLLLHFQNPELGGQVRLNDPYLVLVPQSVDGEEGVETLVLLGTDESRDLWITGSKVDAVEQLLAESAVAEDQTEPPAPMNLSQSGAASDPAIVADPDGTLRAFWWDRFDGLTLADGIVEASSVLSGTEEIPISREIWSEARAVPILLPEAGMVGGEETVVWTPIEGMPQIVADAAGGIHAFWLVEPDELEAVEEEMVVRPLMHSRLEADETGWSSPALLAESAAGFDVATDTSGALHLAYLDTVHTPLSPAGVYYRRLEQGGAGWTVPTTLQQSRYFRPLTPEMAHVRLAADGEGAVYVTWDDPRQEQILLAYSHDGGATWVGPTTVGSPEEPLQRGRLVPVPGGETLLLWERAGMDGSCNLVQAYVEEILGGATDAGRPALEGLTACPEEEEYIPLADGQVLMVAGSGSEALTVAVWDGSTASDTGGGQWSEPSRLSFGFENPALGRQVYLGGLGAASVQLPSGAAGGSANWALIAVGSDQEGDVWATSSQTGDLEMVFAPPPPWSAPVSFAESQGLPGLPAVAFDSESRLHVLWSEESEGSVPEVLLLYARRDEALISSGTEVRWINRTEILRSPEGGADQPSLAAVGDRLHAVWRAGQDGQIFYSQAFASDAYAASGWEEPQPLPAPVALGSWPDVAVDLGGSLHVVYAVPVNEGRGIYYTRSGDGNSWSAERQVFDAAGAGWAVSDYPRLDVDLAGTIHVVWVRADPFGSGLTQAIHYARSIDGGETWSEPLEVADGAYAWPQVIASGAGQVHLLWNEATGEHAWWHQWSADGGLGWTRPERVPNFGNVPGPGGVTADGSGMLHMVGLGRDDRGEPALLYVTWSGQRWAERELFRLDLAKDTPVTGVSSALLPASGQLDVVFRGEGKEVGEVMHRDLWHTGRAVPAVVITPMPTFTPRPTPTPLPTPVPTTHATPTPSFSTAPPQSSEGSMTDLLPLLLPGGLAAVIVAGAFGAGLLVRARRNR